MVKTTKRARKFIAKGGVKAIKKDGKKKKPKPSLNPQEAAKEREERETQQKQLQQKEREDKDFTSEGNLGELDINTFLMLLGSNLKMEVLTAEMTITTTGEVKIVLTMISTIWNHWVQKKKMLPHQRLVYGSSWIN